MNEQQLRRGLWRLETSSSAASQYQAIFISTVCTVEATCCVCVCGKQEVYRSCAAFMVPPEEKSQDRVSLFFVFFKEVFCCFIFQSRYTNGGRAIKKKTLFYPPVEKICNEELSKKETGMIKKIGVY